MSMIATETVSAQATFHPLPTQRPEHRRNLGRMSHARVHYLDGKLLACVLGSRPVHRAELARTQHIVREIEVILEDGAVLHLRPLLLRRGRAAFPELVEKARHGDGRQCLGRGGQCAQQMGVTPAHFPLLRSTLLT